jgi:hypothetical protein
MDFNPVGDRYPNDLINSSFKREIDYLTRLKQYVWSPEVISIDQNKRQVYFKWYDNTAETYLGNGWKFQLHNIVKNLHEEEIWKPSFYPKYFYTDSNDQLHAWAFYSSSDYVEQPINMEFYQPILNPERKLLINQLQVNGCVDMGVLVNYAFNDYIKWPDNALTEIYQLVYKS